ncbi:MAG: EAL domain-containing protein [Candidatus Thiodiazotropha taylori]|nr:EAL domain-containing protein [Candidatus Thiodiazotropha taylori]MCW4328256.1 EAL domain-containing protein [Candidatus Thiodiazotropha taylori]
MHKFLFNRIFFLLIAIGLLINWGIAQANTPMTLRVGVYKNPPLVDTDSMGRPGGLFIDILEQIAHQEGWKVRYVLGTWSDQLYRLSAGKIDLLPAIAINDSRKKRFLFSDQTVIANWGQIYVAENSDIQTIADLHEKNIAVLTDDVYLTSKNGLHEICNSFGIECRTQKYATYDMVMRAIASGRADAGLISRLYGLSHGHFHSPVPSPIILIPLDIRFAISQQSSKAHTIKQRLDFHLANQKSDELSIYHQRLKTLFETHTPPQPQPPLLYQIIFAIGILVGALVLIAQILRWRVRVKTRQLAETEAQYHNFFDGVATALCEGDSSKALARLDQLLDSGVEDLRAYFDNHPDQLREMLFMLRVVNANPASFRLFGVKSLKTLQQWLPKSITPEVFTAFKAFLIASSEKQTVFTCEVPLLTAKGQLIQVMISFPLSDSVEEVQHMPVTLVDVSHLRETEKQLSLVVKGASLGFWDWNLVTDQLTVNQRWLDQLGLEPSDMKHNIDDWRDRLHPKDRERIMPIINQRIEEGKTYNVEFRMKHANGQWAWIEGSGGAVEFDPITQRPTRACGTHQEISERKRAAETLNTLMESMVGITGEDFFEHVARELCRWFGADGANIGELVGRNQMKSLANLIDGRVIEDFSYRINETPCDKVIRQGPCLFPQGVQDLFPKDEDLVLLDVQGYAGSPIRDRNNVVIGIVWVVSRKPLFMPPDWADVMDIIAARISAEIERMRAMERLAYQATYDSLTALPNRRLLIDRLGQAQSRCRRHHHRGAVLFMDLDHFKTINDSLGHNVGDLLLQQVAERLTSEIRDEDTASRLGGDEFIVLFSELDGNPQIAAQQARQGAEKIQSSLSKPYNISDNELHITPSIGIVIFPMDGASADDILKYADTAMYRAKEEGRNTIRFFLPGMQDAAEQQLRLQNDLRNALINDELSIYYQPQLDLDGNLVSVEALLRWHHPNHGQVDPRRFITVAEESGQILQISEWVLNQALLKIKHWSEQLQDPLNLAVNISAVHFHQASFADQIEELVTHTGVDPRHLTLEIHEGTLVENFEEATEKVLKLKKLGVRFSIDCFGIGYASIAYIRRLPVDQLKIDRSFIRDISSDPKDAQLVQTIITMAQNMDIEVVAIGVETDAQLKFLRDKGCRIFQGYYFSHPLPVDQFESYLSKETA